MCIKKNHQAALEAGSEKIINKTRSSPSKKPADVENSEKTSWVVHNHRYNIEQLLVASDYTQDQEDRVWIDAPRVGRELI